MAHLYLTILVVTAGVLFFMGWVLNQKAMGEPEAIFPMWLAFCRILCQYRGARLGRKCWNVPVRRVPRSPVTQVIIQDAE